MVLFPHQPGRLGLLLDLRFEVDYFFPQDFLHFEISLIKQFGAVTYQLLTPFE
jgi:hypothetical protein